MRRILSALALALLVVGPPALLSSLGFYDWGRLSLWLPADGRFLLAALTVLGWCAWAIFLLSVVVELRVLLRPERGRPQLPGLGKPRTLAGLLLAGVLATSSASGAMATPLEAPPTMSAAAGAIPDASPAPPASDGATTVTLSSPVSRAEEQSSSVATLTHVVQRGDDLWSLAEHYFGSGNQWRTIARANPGVLGSDPTADLAVGTRLTITLPTEQYTVRHGDTLWHLAQEHLGDGARYTELQQLNADRIDDPDYIETGWSLRLPHAEMGAKPAEKTGPSAAPAPIAPKDAARPSPTPTRINPGQTAIAGVAPASATPSSSATGAPTLPAERVAAPAPFDHVAVRVLLGGLAAVAASGLLGRLLQARREREDQRALGTTFGSPSQELERFETALGLAQGTGPGASTAASREILIDRALRLLADHWSTSAQGVRPLRRALLTDERLTFEFVSPAACPPAFDETGPAACSISWSELAGQPTPPVRAAYPALVTLGESESGALTMVDLTGWGALALDGSREDLAEGSLAAMVVELSCAPWVDDGTVTVVTDDPAFVDAAALAHVRCVIDPVWAVEALERQAHERSGLIDLDNLNYDHLCLDPDRGDAWAPAVYLFERPLAPDLVERISLALDGRRIGVGAVFPLSNDADAPVVAPAQVPATLTWTSAQPDDPRATLVPDGLVVSAQTLSSEAKDAIIGLYKDARSTETIQAPWWADYAVATLSEKHGAVIRRVPEPPDDDAAVLVFPTDPETATVPSAVTEPCEEAAAPAAITPAAGGELTGPGGKPRGPRLRLFGKVTLEGAAGALPQKAASRCLEYCAWLLEHPGAVASEMNRALFVTDATRRSNLSRLRSWLGLTPEGAPYLPEAYTGHIELHEAVTSDWADFLRLVSPGANVLGRDRLREALGLVVGAPMADASPGSWAWAETLRATMCEAVRDTAVALARLENQRRDHDGVRWAYERGCVVAPHDELLARELMQSHAACGDLDALRALLRQLERHAARNDTELSPDTVALAQSLLEGGPRAVLAATGSEG